MHDIAAYENSSDQTDDITVLSCFYSGQSIVASVSVSIENELANIAQVTESFDTFCEEQNISTAVNQKVDLAIDDLVNNIISYGYHDTHVHTIDIAFKRMENELIIVIEDDAIPFNPFDAEADSTHLSIDERDIVGLGIHLVKSLMQSCQYQRKANKNVVALTIQL
jgi:sigma-B regulation protein RsbU (phosphoserine phosphatase)